MKTDDRESIPLDLAALRSRLSGLRGDRYWRSLEELGDSDTFHELLEREFPQQASAWNDTLGRREFLKLMGASLALAGLTACGRSASTNEKIVPYVRQPETLVPGKPQFFATAFVHDGAAIGLLVESHEGRPTKIEGNPAHPGSLGATDTFAQASILTLYDPDRSQVVTNVGAVATWNGFFAALNGELEGQRLNGGAGLRILTETVVSPTLADQLQTFLKRYPKAKWHQYEPANRDNVRVGARLAFGEMVEPQYHFDRCETILSLDEDFLLHGPGRIRYARNFIERRRVRDGNATMNRLYVVESTPSVTGAMADHRLPLRPSDIGTLAQALAGRLGVSTGATNAPAPDASYGKWLDVVTRDLQQHRGAGLVLAGRHQPAPVHALVHLINQNLGNTGKTVVYTEAIEPYPVEQNASLRDLAADMESGQVGVLLIIGGNPVFNAPADLQFGELMARVGFSVHMGLYEDETSARCHWHVPETHYLETWSDARAYDGTLTILQPLIDPLYGGKSVHELLAAVVGRPGLSSYEIVREYWIKQSRVPDFERFWRKALHDGVVAGSAFTPKTVGLKNFAVDTGGEKPAAAANASTLEIIFQADPTIHDGRFANNGWLQELPKPMTKITWDNAVLVSPATAERLKLGHRVGTRGGEHGRIFADVVELRYAGRTVTAPVWIAPGHADGCATVYFGYGRTRAGKVGTGTGFNAYALRTSAAPWQSTRLEMRKTGDTYALACTQFHQNMEGRDLVRAATLEEYRREPHFAAGKEHGEEAAISLYPQHPYDGYAWGMAIDTNACIACNACVIACQAENNIPVVGKTEVTRGREMHWIRIDRYYQGGLDNPESLHQPVPCMHCENAPCEVVCPVNATTHSSEGLNEMVYNRCVGTRYCSNNCPYKVRRFNFFQYSDFTTPSLKPLRNPNVTVRSRGIMEKCTYCVQRINAARITAEKENRGVRDGEITTACQSACPTEAIIFGDINDRNSRVSRLKASPLNYGILTELNTRPRTTYLAKLKNPNPELTSE